MFLEFILAPLNEFNTSFQADASKIGLLQQQTTRLLRRFMAKFVKSSVIQQHSDLTTVPYKDRNNQIDDEKLAVGLTARSYMDDVQDDIKLSALARCFRTVRNFYVAVADKIIAKFPLDDPTLKNMMFLNPSSRADITPESVLQIARRFHVIKEEESDALVEEVLDYTLAPTSEVPAADAVDPNLGKYWQELSDLTDPFTMTERYPLLSKVAKCCLVIPVSNADSERMFSFMKRIHCDNRSELQNDTICALMTAKQNSNEDCYQFNPSNDMLFAAKHACVRYNTSLEDTK